MAALVSGPLPIAVLASGEGTTCEALAGAIAAGRLDARIALVVVDRPGAHVIDRAQSLGLETIVLPRSSARPPEWSRLLTELLRARGVGLVVLAGFLAILPPDFVATWSGRVINLHPSLLPRHGGRGMYGRRVHEAVLAAHEAETGVTVHLVTEAVDAGPTLWQARLPVAPDDTPDSLRARLRPLELAGLTAVISAFAEGRWTLPYPTH